MTDELAATKHDLNNTRSDSATLRMELASLFPPLTLNHLQRTFLQVFLHVGSPDIPRATLVPASLCTASTQVNIIRYSRPLTIQSATCQGNAVLWCYFSYTLTRRYTAVFHVYVSCTYMEG